MTRRARILCFGAAAILIVVGAAGAAVFTGVVGEIVALVLIGLGFVLATALVFLEVGLSEERERAADQGVRQTRGGGAEQRGAVAGEARGEGRAEQRAGRAAGGRGRLRERTLGPHPTSGRALPRRRLERLRGRRRRLR